MKFIKKFAFLIFIFTLSLFAFKTNVNKSFALENNKNKVANNENWVIDKKGNKFYKTNNSNAVYWHNIDGEWYYFGSDGKMAVGWWNIPTKDIVGKTDNDYIEEKAVKPTWHYFDENGVLVNEGWKFLPTKKVNINKVYGDDISDIALQKKWFYFDENGAIKTDWIFNKDTWYFLSVDKETAGEMKIGWIFNNNKWYYLNDSGAMEIDWVYVSNNWYYLNKSGAMETGWVYVSNNWYYLNKSGAMETGWVYVSNNWYYLNNSGAMETGWLKYNDKWYYFDSNGAMLTGRQEINNTIYYFNSSGALN